MRVSLHSNLFSDGAKQKKVLLNVVTVEAHISSQIRGYKLANIAITGGSPI